MNSNNFKFLLIVFLSTITNSYSFSQTNSWKGFELHNLKFENRDVRIVIPKKANQEKPWVWKARFPKYHANIDSTLASKGHHYEIDDPSIVIDFITLNSVLNSNELYNEE